MTQTRSAISDTTARLWVMKIKPISPFCLRSSRLEQIEDLRLDNHVERGGRLVGDEKARAVGNRGRDHGALALAAGKLMRIGARALRRVGQANLLEETDRLRGGFAAGEIAMRQMPSATWSPTRCTGLRQLAGSWNTIAISLPRSARMSPSAVRAMSRDRPARSTNWMRPLAIVIVGGSRRSTARAP